MYEKFEQNKTKKQYDSILVKHEHKNSNSLKQNNVAKIISNYCAVHTCMTGTKQKAGIWKNLRRIDNLLKVSKAC